MSREDDKRRKEAEWFDESQTAWLHKGYMVTHVPGYSHLYRVRNEDDTAVEAVTGHYTDRKEAFAAIDQHVAKEAIANGRAE